MIEYPFTVKTYKQGNSRVAVIPNYFFSQGILDDEEAVKLKLVVDNETRTV